MADRIIQTMGFDAAEALRVLEQLNGGFQTLDQRLQSLAGSIGQFNKAAGNKQAAALATSFRSTSAEAANLNARVEKLTVSTGLIARILTTQLTVSIFGKFRRELIDTAKVAADFQKSIALATTIADGATFDQIADSVRKLSDEFNLPLLEASAGVYQTLSNQVGDYGESIKFAAEAARFAKATNSSFEDSVDLLSAALKGYNLTAADTDKVSSIFFATIDKGRISASELANSFGRVDTIAADIGVSLEETGGALAAISVRGTKTSEALTQFRAILSALQKPSEAMEQRLAELGFTSSEVAIKTLGFTGVLDALSKSTGGSAEELAKLFPNVRGLSGAASLTSDELVSLSQNIREMTEAGRNFNKEKFLQATATDAERVTKEINKLSNEIKLGLGNSALSAADNLFNLTGGAEGLIEAGKVAIPTIAGIAGAMVLLKGSTMAANAELSVFSKALGALALVPVAAGIGASIGSFIEDKRLNSLFEDLTKLKAEDAKYLAEFESGQKQQRDAFNRTNEARVQAALQANLELNKAYMADVANAKTAAEKKAAFDKFASQSSVDEKSLGLLLGRKLETPDQVARGLIDAQKKAAELKTQLDESLAGEEGVKRLQGNLDQVFKDLERLESSRNLVATGKGEGLRAQYANVLDMLKRLRSDSNVTAEELQKVIEFRNALGEDALKGGGIANTGFASMDRIGFASTINQLDEALATLVEIQRIQSTLGDTTALQGQLTALEGVLAKAAPEVRFKSVAAAISSAVPPAERIQAAFENAAAAAERAAGAIGSSDAKGFSTGGLAYLAEGGQAKGTDTIPAMLTAGEFVINAKSSRRFFSQLQAINAGVQPTFNSSTVRGGDVNIGDIHINEATSAKDTARQLMDMIRREQRRGTGAL